MTKTSKLPEGDELGVNWDRLADGRAHRLKRKRHFGDVDPMVAREAAQNAAKRMGKAVQTARDKQNAKKFIWVQFADREIPLGAPCPVCGSRKLLRVHTYFVRCAKCHARLLLNRTSVDEREHLDYDLRGDEERSSEAADILDDFDDAWLDHVERIGDREIYRGYATREGDQMLVVAEFTVGPGEEVTPGNAVDRVASIDVIPFRHLGQALDAASLTRRPESSWDLVL